MQKEYQLLLTRQRAYFSTGVTQNIQFRIEQLKRLKEWIKQHDAEISAALKQDLGKSEFESYASEIMGTVAEIDLAIKKLASWSQPQKVKTPLMLFKARSEIIYEPLGIVLVISPWNYPFGLSVTTLIGVIAAGNCCVVKPSEIAHHTSKILQMMIQDCFDEVYCAVIEGGVEETTTLLQERFDLIHFTGSTQVGKVIALAAAKHLTPVVLELGGKSPCIVDQTADIQVTARRICWGKFINAGQTCVAPDFILVHKTVKDQLIHALCKEICAFYGEDPEQSSDYGRIINKNHFERLCSLLTKGEIVHGGQTKSEQLYIAPTLVDGIYWDDPIMQSEIFGPLLPIVTYDDLSQAIMMLKKQEKPLALYLFSKDSMIQKKIVNELSFGGGCINATILHLVNSNLPFGGVGHSGMGSYHGKWSFAAFSHKKSVLNRSLAFDFRFLYPPFKDRVRWIKRMIKK